MFGGPTNKYRGMPQDDGGVPLNWQSHTDGYPMRVLRGDPMLTPDEIPDVGLEYDANYDCFHLPEQRDEYLQVRDKYVNGWFYIEKEREYPDPNDPSKLFVHVWWYEIFASDPTNTVKYRRNPARGARKR